MAIYRNVHLSFWTDNKVEDEFTPEDKFFYIYLLTNPQTNICGCYEVSWSQLTNQTGYNKDTVLRLLERFEKVHNVIRFNKETKEILILNWHKYNWSKSEKTLVGVENVAKHIKSDEFRKYIFAMVNNVRNGQDDVIYECPIEASVSDTDSDTVINNSNQEIDDSNDNDNIVDFEKAWNKTVDRYPKKTNIATAKQNWMRRITVAQAVNEREQLATDIYQAIKMYLDYYHGENPEDEKYKYVPKFGVWLEEDCDYWLRQLENARAGND